jgi:arylsulfatase A-like enzyme
MVTSGKRLWSDEHRINAVFEFLERSRNPVFAHLHLMGTHSPHNPRERVYSIGVTWADRRARADDLYDDVIAGFDRQLQAFVERLERMGKLGNTVLVITSDHGAGWTYARVPLIFVFPGGEPSGRRTLNGQLIDLAPTLLDYLGVPIPSWMNGQSLLRDDLDPKRPIVTVLVRKENPAPFKRIRAVGVTICQHVYWLDPWTSTFFTERVPGGTATCRAGPEGEWIARPLITTSLRDNGYDVSSLKRIPRAHQLPPPWPPWMTPTARNDGAR